MGSPGDNILRFPELLELHSELTLPDFIAGEHLQVGCETKLVADPDEPLGWVILVPSDRVTVVTRELMMEIVVSLADCDKCSEEVVPWSVLVIEGRLAKPVRQRVDAERRLE